MLGFVLAVWIGIEGLGIAPQQSYDYGFHDDCAIMVTCGAGITFSAYSYDVADLGDVSSIATTGYGITAWQGSLSLDGQLSYTTQTGYTWSPGDLGHFLFLRATTGELYVAIEDMPAFWPEGGLYSDLDYNDALYRVEPMVATPEPGSIMLLGSGLLLMARRLRKKVKSDQHPTS